MANEKIPTDGEILERVIAERRYFGKDLGNLSSSDEIYWYYAEGLALEAMKQARAAGRAEGAEEQISKMLEVVHLIQPEFVNPEMRHGWEAACFQMKMELEAIRHQAEGTKEGEQE